MKKFIFYFLPTSILFGLPQSPIIEEGLAEFVSSSHELCISANDRSIISWSDFSIASDEKAVFSLPSAESLIINRVREPNPSLLMGRLESNGRVVLLNPHGMIVGKEGIIDTASFLAATLDLQERNTAEAKEWVLTAGKGEISVLGLLEAKKGSVILIGDKITHSGSLVAEGDVAFFSLDHFGSANLNDFEAFSRLAKESFQPQEDSFFTVSGNIRSHQGDVQLYAKLIGLEGCTIDTSRFEGAGKIEIGFPEMDSQFAAKRIFFDPTSTLASNSLDSGNGGFISLIANEAVFFEGRTEARGGENGGDGGTVKLCAPYFTWNGTSDLKAPLGKAGLLHLDPTDIVITLAATSTTVLIPGITTWTAAAIPNSPVQINNLALAGVLGGANVLIDTATLFDFGNAGDITVAINAPVVWNSANSLELRANNNIFVFADILNGPAAASTGNITLTACGPSVIVTGNFSSVFRYIASVGSCNGITTVNAPNATVEIGGTFAPSPPPSGLGGQIGYRPDAAAGAIDTCTGPILVNCRELILNNSIFGFRKEARIGHGGIDFASTAMSVTTTATATISVTTTADILIRGFGSENGSFIGHGTNYALAPTDLRGNISVNCGGDLSLLTPAAPGASLGACIGHGLGVAGGTISGHISVRVPNGSVTLSGEQVLNVVIGHRRGLGTTFPPNLSNIEVCCGVDLAMEGPIGGSTVAIAHLGNQPYSGTTLVTVGRDLFVNKGICNGNTFYTIGTLITGALNPFSTQVVCGRNLNVDLCTDSCLIGANNTNPGSLDAQTFVAAGGDILLNTSPSSTINIIAPGNVFVTAGGNITATTNPPASGISIATQNRVVPGRTVCIYAGGDLTGTIGTVFGEDQGGLDPNYRVDFRAGGNLQMANDLQNADLGIYIEAAAFFAPGQLWNYAGGTITSICGASLPFPQPCITGCSTFCPPSPCCLPFPACTSICIPPTPCPAPPCGSFLFLPTAISSSSPAVCPNCSGAFSKVSVSRLYFSTTGDITIHSSNQNLSIGNTPSDDIFIENGTFAPGVIPRNIEIYGTDPTGCGGNDCRRCSFNNVTINQALNATGTVLICADRDLIFTAIGSINTTPAGRVTLICDNDFPALPNRGPGQFIMNAGSFITTGTAALNIYTAQPGLNTINGTLNGQTFGSPLPDFLVDSCNEAWCTYYCTSIPLICAVPTTPPDTQFTIAYKICRNIIPNGPGPGAIVTQFLVSLHPYNEFPGWMTRFWFDYALVDQEYPIAIAAEPYMLRRRHLKSINHPKTWAQLAEDDHPRPVPISY